MAASMGGVSCLVLIFSLFDTLSRLRGVDMRDQVTKSLSEPPFDTLAVSTADVLAGMRALAFVSGALAAAGVVLAVFVFRRHRGARIGFTVVAALLLLTTPVAGMLTIFVGIAAVLLWSEPARAWFAGRAPEDAQARRREEVLMSAGDRSTGGPGPQGWPYGEPDRTGEEPTSQVPPAGPPSPPPADGPQPPPYPGSYGEAPGQGEEPPPWQQPEQSAPPAHPQQPGPYGPGVGYPVGPYGEQQDAQGGHPYGGYPPAGGSGKRPATVTWAAALAILGSLIGLLAGGMLMIGLALGSGSLADEIQRDDNFRALGWDVDQVLAVVWVTAVVLVVWSLSALVFAIFTLRRQQWARWLLVISAAATALVSLLAIMSIVSVLPLVMAIATVVLLFTGGANAWFSGQQDRQPPSGPQWSSQPGPW